MRNNKFQKEKETKQTALIKILSCILSCSFDYLMNIEKSRYKKRVRNIILALLSLFIILFSVSFFIWDYNRTKIEYYNTFVYQYGIPKGIGKFTKK